MRTDGLYNYLQSYKSRRRRPAEPIKMSENYYARGKHDSHPSHLIAAPATINPLPPTVAPRRVRRTTAKSFFFFPTSPPTRGRRPRRRFIRPCYFIDSTSLGRELGPRGGEYIFFFSFISRYSLDTSFPGTKSRPHTISEYLFGFEFCFFPPDRRRRHYLRPTLRAAFGKRPQSRFFLLSADDTSRPPRRHIVLLIV